MRIGYIKANGKTFQQGFEQGERKAKEDMFNMKHFGFLFVIALSLFLFHACANLNTKTIIKEGPAIATAGHSENPDTGITAQEAVSPTEQSTRPESGAESTTPSVSEKDDSGEVSPQIASEESEKSVQEGISTDSGNNKGSPSPEANTIPDITVEQKPTAEIPQNDTGEQPPILTRSVQDAGLTFDGLPFSQLVLIAAEGSDAMIYCYDKGENGQWKISEDIGYIKGYVGKNGVSAAKSEGDNCTPAGLFDLGYAFGNRSKPLTGMEYRVITEESYWVDDPESQYYNQWVEGTIDADWNSAEYLSENQNTYAYAVVVEYNMAPNTVTGKGSAIFLHIKNEPTSGCIAVSETAMLKILKWLSSDKNPGILIAAQ